MYKHFHFRHMHVRSASQKYFFARCLVMVVRGLLVSTSLSMSAYAPALPLPASGALPSGGVVSSGNGVISSSGTQMNVTQSSQKLVINWNSFDIGSNAAVNFNQPNAQAVALNRINSTSPSQIYGRLTANGQLFFINPNGVVFGPGSQVNAAALIVSTHNLSDANFLSGNYLFNPVSVNSAAILNQGSIQVHNGGVVTLIAHNINNVGSISAPGGTIGLLAGDTVTVPLSLQGSHPFMVSATSAGDASIINSGTLSAAGGTIQISALNSASSSNATTLTNNAVINNSGIIDVSSNTNNGGSIYTDSGVIGINQSSGTLLATSSQGLGGNITILGDKVGLLANSQTNADGALGGGTILIGGNWHGEGPEHNANVVYIDRAATIHADATSQGDGGQVVLWSDDYTGFYGLISARGGKLGGNGGQVETSSKKTLIVSGGRVVLFAAQGGVGRWLLDPGNVTISAAATTIVPAANVYTAPVSSMGYVSVADIDAALANGTSVTVTTGLASPDGVYGHMYVLSSINPLMTKGNATLTLTAALDISVASGVNIGPAATSTNALNLVFNANSAIVIGGNLSTNGGSILFNGNTSVQNSTVAQTFLTNGGAVTFGGANGRALLIANTRGFNIDTTVANGHAGAVTFNGTVDSGNQFSYVAGTVNWLQAHLGAQGYGCTLVNPGGCAASQHPNAIGASYLATINSAFENSLAGLSTCSATGTGCFSSAWLGGSRLTADLLTTTYDPVTHQYYFSNAAMKAALGCAAASTTCSPTLTSAPNGLPIATWQWVSGPLSLANNGKGTVFYNTTTNSATGPVNGVYTNWNSSTVGTGEPNNAGNEYALQFTGSNGVWNDLNPSSSGSATGYIVETNLAHSVLTINAGTGANAGVVTFNGLVGNAHPLASLNVTGQIAMQGGGVTTDSLQVYAGDMNLGANQNTILKQTGTIYNVDGTTSVSSVNFQLQPGHVITNGNSNETSLTIDTTGSINLNAGNNISSSGSNGKLNVTLNSDSAGALLGVTDTGIHIAGAAITTNGGSIALGGGAGTGTNAALGIALTNGGSLNSAGGNIALTSAANTAISMDAASQIAAGAGNISLIADTMQLPVAVSSRITGSGSLTLNTYTANRAIELGDTSGSGLNLAAGLFGGANATLAPGFSVITVGGANAGAITLGANTTFTSNLALVSGGAITLNGALNNSGNTVTLTGGNNALVSGNGNITASGLLLNGSGAIYALNTAANNNVNTLAATGAASINFKNNRSLTVGTVGTVSGVSAAGNITIAAVDAQGVSSGSAVDLTLNNAVRSTSGNIALTAGRAFYNNNATDTGIVVASGSRYTVYSYSPMNLAGGGSARGMTLNASTQKHYNVSNPASANYASGNWFLYAMQPTLTAGINGATITYGDLFTPSFTGYTGFIDGDTSSTVTGAPGLIVSGGRSTSGNYTAGQHNMTVDLTNVATNLGYAFTSGGAQLTVNKKEIVITGGTVTATSRPYSGTANNIVAVNDTGFHLSGVMTNDVIASSVSTGIGRMQDGNAGVNKHVVVDLNSLIKGADAGNYFANTVAVSTTVTISPVQLIANASSVTKVFDGTLNVPGKGQVQLNLQPGDQLIGSLFSESYANAMPQGKGGSVVLVINPSAAWSISNAYGDALQNYLLPVVLNSASGTILPIPSIPANGNNPFISLGGGDDNDNNNGDVNNPRNSEGKMMVGMTCTIFDKTHGIWQGCGVVKNRRLAHARSGSNPALIF